MHQTELSKSKFKKKKKKTFFNDLNYFLNFV